MADENAVAQFGGWSGLLEALVEGNDLSVEQASAAMEDILAGRATQAQIAAMVVAVRAKGETVDELVGFATAMRAAAEPLSVAPEAIDIVGTGGSKHRRDHALNISTMASIVASAAGAVVCKHGNRKASSTSGSFDFLEALGVTIELEPRALEQCVAEIGLGFAFARSFHPAMRFAGPVRVELGIPTVFNQLGPIAHPAKLQRQVVGTANENLAQATAEVLRSLGSQSAWVVTGAGGLDELTTTGPTVMFEVSPNEVVRSEIHPEELGLPLRAPDDLAGGGAERNSEIFEAMVAGEHGPCRDIVLLNAGAGLVVAKVADDLADGIARAAEAMNSGQVGAKLADLRRVTADLASSA